LILKCERLQPLFTPVFTPVDFTYALMDQNIAEREGEFMFELIFIWADKTGHMVVTKTSFDWR